LVGLVLGVVGGATASLLWKGSARLDWVVANLADPIGQVFLRLLLMVVIPLVFSSLSVGIATLGEARSLGRVGGRALAWFVGLAALGAVVGLTVTAVVRPGAAISDEMRASLLATIDAPAADSARGSGLGVGTVVNLVPANVVEAAAQGDLLGILLFTLLFGAALGGLPTAVAAPVLRFLEGVAQVAGGMVRLTMNLAPLGVAGLAFAGLARFGFEFLRPLGLYVGVVLAGLLIVQFGVYPLLVRVVANRSPAVFFGKSQPAMVTALATASSNATLPTTIRVAREGLEVPPAIAGFVIPLAASLSRAGTSIFTASTALFLAQALGLETTLLEHAGVLGLATVTAVAAGGVPSGVIPLLATVIAGAGVPSAAIALILGVEPILGMARTVPNVTGGLVAAAALATADPGIDSPNGSSDR
jgi:DAACS family dicarboxylate/amino acid:cation (Na+ or H+) symporter